MAKFKFRLETLLRLRGTARDERRSQLAQAYRAEEILQQQRLRLESDLNELSKESCKAAEPGPLDVDRLLETRRYELVLRSQQQFLEGQRKTLEAEIERRRQALVEADREVRVLERLRERQLDRHRRDENRQEIKHLDEVAVRQTCLEDN